MSSDDVMASILHLAQKMEKDLSDRDQLSLLALHHPSPRLWLLAAANMADVVPAVAVVTVVVAFQTSAMHAAVWTT
jgi:hypothetical protein